MSLSLLVKGTSIDFELRDREVTGYKFIYKTSGSEYAKSGNDERYLEVKGDILLIAEKGLDILKGIREWVETKCSSPDYYNSVKIAEIFAGREIRSITFPNAYIKKYEEKADFNTGRVLFDLIFTQKKDKYIDIIIEPFNENFSTLSEIMGADTNAGSKHSVYAMGMEKVKYDYIKDLELKLGYPVNVDDKPFKRIPVGENAKMREEFSDCKDDLIEKWEAEKGKNWPRYTEDFIFKNRRDVTKVIRKKGDRYDAHHIKPLCLGGKNEPSNIVPMHAKDHFDKQGVHAPGSPFGILMEERL